MHSRLPLMASAPGTSVAAALTAALLLSGCNANPFGPAETAELQPASAAQMLPAAAQESAGSSAHDAAAQLAERIENAVAEAAPDSDPATATAVLRSGHRSTVEHASTPRLSPAQLERIELWADDVAQARQDAEAQATAEEQAQVPPEEPEPSEEPETPEEPPAEPEETEPAEEPAPPESPDPPALDPGHNPITGSFAVPFTGDLQTYVNELASAHPGSISISVREVTGSQRSASTAGSTTRVTASTYKLFLAYSIIRQVEDGAMSWSDSVLGDRDLAGCFQDMVVFSDNPCPEAIGPEIGWTEIYSDAAGAGANRTGQGEGAIVTSADDLTSLLTRLEAGSLAMSGSGHQRLQDALAANIHRQGVPAGSSGQVLNKPGFINGYLHDAAIVRHPQGTYVLSIMSEGSSWDALASITAQIEAALYG